MALTERRCAQKIFANRKEKENIVVVIGQLLQSFLFFLRLNLASHFLVFGTELLWYNFFLALN